MIPRHTLSADDTDGVGMKVVSGQYHTGLLPGNGELWVVGRGGYGQLGMGSTANAGLFVKSATVPPGKSVQDVDCTANSTVIRLDDDSLMACGLNNSGQLGIGSTVNQSSFVYMSTLPSGEIKKLSCGGSYVAVLFEDGRLYGCGAGHPSFVAMDISSLPSAIEDLFCGDVNMMLLLKDGELWEAPPFGIFTKCAIPSGKRVKKAAGGNSGYILVLFVDGEIWGRGRNVQGSLGMGNTTDVAELTKCATLPPGVRMIDVAIHNTDSLILSEDGKLFGCGQNNEGEIGMGSSGRRTSFVEATTIPQKKKVKHVSHGSCTYGFCFVILDDKTVYVAGNGYTSSFAKMAAPWEEAA